MSSNYDETLFNRKCIFWLHACQIALCLFVLFITTVFIESEYYMEEIFKTCVEAPNYEISNFGRLRNKKTGHFRAFSDNGTGYMTVQININKKTKSFYIHRLVANAFIEKNNLLQNEVNHKDGDKKNNCVSNLEWCTSRENNIHAIKFGLRPTTEKMRQNAKFQLKNLTKEQLEKGRAKINQIVKSKSQKGLVRWESKNQFVPLYCVELNKFFLCSSRVEEKIGIKKRTIQKAMSAGYKTCGGYHWKRLKNRFSL